MEVKDKIDNPYFQHQFWGWPEVDDSGGVLSADVHPLDHSLPGDLCQSWQMASLPLVCSASSVLQTAGHYNTEGFLNAQSIYLIKQIYLHVVQEMNILKTIGLLWLYMYV